VSFTADALPPSFLADAERRQRIGVGAALILAVLACGCGSGRVCNGFVRIDAAIEASVVDAASGFAICDATVAAHTGAASFPLTGGAPSADAGIGPDSGPGACPYALSAEGLPSGTFEISVSAPGYTPTSMGNIAVQVNHSSGGCSGDSWETTTQKVSVRVSRAP
jgi:hypothetical protein